MLSIKNLSKTFRKPDAVALTDISFELNDGDICGVVGNRNGGRTTLLNIIAGIVSFVNGEVTVDGMSLKDDPDGCTAVTAYVPETPGYVRSMSVLQYLNFMSDLYGLTREEREERITRWSAMFELTAVLNEYISDLSDAFRYRLGVVGALIRQPRLLVMEHPFDRADKQGDRILEEAMRKLSEGGTIIVFTSCHFTPLEKMCNKMVQLTDGRLTRFGEVTEIAGEDGKLFNDVRGIEMVTTKKKDSTNPYSSDEDKPEKQFDILSSNSDVSHDIYVLKPSKKKTKRLAPEGMAQIHWWTVALQWLIFAGISNLCVFSFNASGKAELISALLPIASIITTFIFTFSLSSAVLFGHSIFGGTRSLTARILKMALLDALMSATVMVPGLVLMAMERPVDVLFIAAAAVGTLGLPMISLAAALLAGALYAAFRFVVNNPWILYAVLTTATMVFSMVSRSVRAFATLDSIKTFSLNMLRAAGTDDPLCRLFNEALTGGNIASLGILAAICALCLALPVCTSLAFPNAVWNLVVIPSVSANTGSVSGLKPSSASAALYKVETSYFLSNFQFYIMLILAAVGVTISIMVMDEDVALKFSTKPQTGVLLAVSWTTMVLSFYNLMAVMFVRPLHLTGEPWLMVSRSPAPLSQILRAKVMAFFTLALPLWALFSALFDLMINTVATRGGMELSIAHRMLMPFIALSVISFYALAHLCCTASSINASRNTSLSPNAVLFWSFYVFAFTSPVALMFSGSLDRCLIIGYAIYGVLALLCPLLYRSLMRADFRKTRDAERPVSSRS